MSALTVAMLWVTITSTLDVSHMEFYALVCRRTPTLQLGNGTLVISNQDHSEYPLKIPHLSLDN